MARLRFDPRRPLVAARAFTYHGKKFAKDDPFPTEGIDPRVLKKYYEGRYLHHGEGQADATAAEPVQMEPQPGGWYQISAPWLDEPERIKGKVRAERRLAELREAGEPEYHHGVTTVESDNGWWHVLADWDNEGEKVHGEEAARARAAELRAEGPPPDPRTDVTLAEEEGEFVVNAPWLEEPLIFEDRADAETQVELTREAGPPEGWEPAEPTE
jgi:hypothetical protein